MVNVSTVIGVLGPETLIETLQDTGLEVVGGPNFVTTALQIRRHPQAPAFPILAIARGSNNRLYSWLGDCAEHTRVAALGDDPRIPDDVTRVKAGDSLALVCRQLGLSVDIDESIVLDESGDVTFGDGDTSTMTASIPVVETPAQSENVESTYREQEYGSGTHAHQGQSYQSEPAPYASTPAQVGHDTHTVTPPHAVTEPYPEPPQAQPQPYPARPPHDPPAPYASTPAYETPEPQHAPQPHPEPAPYPSVQETAPSPYASAPQPHAEPYTTPPPPAPTTETTQSIVRDNFTNTNLDGLAHIFGDEENDPYATRKRRKGELLIPYARKGGVGKTTMSLALAHRAASRGLRVVLIDGNRGQSDLRVILRLTQRNLPSIYDAAVTNDPKRAILSPEMINHGRSENLDPIHFAFVSAPPASELADPTVVTADLYRQVVEAARRVADLVVFDTQIIESHDTTGIIDGLVVPELQAGAWGLGLSDLAIGGIKHLADYNDTLIQKRGIKQDRLLIAINRIFPDSTYNSEVMRANLGTVGVFLGGVSVDQHVTDQMNLGHIPGDGSVFDEILNAVLHRVTGRDEFTTTMRRHAGASAGGKKKFGLFGKAGK